MTVTFDSRLADQEPRLIEMLSLTRWRRVIVETIVLLAAATLLQHWGLRLDAIPGVPHLYWIPVLLASVQYGMSAGVIATVAASLAYCLELSPPSAAQDYYAYAGMVAVQPALWLGTALVVGGLRNLQIHQFTALADELAASRRCASDVAAALERAAAEINALEARIAADTNSVAALSRSLSLLDLRDRRSALASYCEVFRAGSGATAFTVYLKQSEGYVPACGCEDAASLPTSGLEPLSPTAVEAMLSKKRQPGEHGCTIHGSSERGYEVVPIPPTASTADPLGAIVCHLPASQDAGAFRRRAGDLSRALAAILSACPDQRAEARR